jgi:two-component system CheB/CheR fusion protein
MVVVVADPATPSTATSLLRLAEPGGAYLAAPVLVLGDLDPPEARWPMPETRLARLPGEIPWLDDPIRPRAGLIARVPRGKSVRLEDGSLRLCDAAPDEAIEASVVALARAYGSRLLFVQLAPPLPTLRAAARIVAEQGGIVLAAAEALPGLAEAPADQPLHLVAPAESVLRLLGEIVRLRDLEDLAEAPPALPVAVARIVDALHLRFGLDLAAYKTKSVGQRIARRIRASAPEEPRAYADRVIADGDALDELYSDLIAGVPRFFRDPSTFHRLAEQVVPELIDRLSATRSLRVWVPAAGTGEEAYSVAMLLLEHAAQRGRPPNIKLFATDVHAGALAQAARGVYQPAAASDLEPERLERFFRVEASALTVRPELRRLIVFSRHDLLQDAPFPRIDLIVCRNLLSALTLEAQGRVVDLLQFALVPGGYLQLGARDILPARDQDLQTVDVAARIWRKLAPSERRASSGLRWRLPDRARLPVAEPPRFASAAEADLRQAYEALLGDYVPSSLLVRATGELLHCFGDAGRWLQVPRGSVSSSVLEMVEDDLRIALGAALARLLKERQTQRLGAAVRDPETGVVYDVVVRPVTGLPAEVTLALILFERHDGSTEAPEWGEVLVARSPLPPPQHDELQQQLEFTRRHLRDLIERLEASNEQLLSTNAQLIAANEELQATNEELQATNQELQTVNAERQSKIDELLQVTNDLDNLLRSTDIGTIFVDKSLRVRKLTPAVVRLLGLTAEDQGRSVDQVMSRLDWPELGETIRASIEVGIASDRRVQDRLGRWLMVRALPYRTETGTIAGAVVNLIDVTALKQAEDAVRQSRERLRFTLANTPAVIYARANQPPFAVSDLGGNAERQLGYPPDVLLGDPHFLHDRVHPDDRPRLERALSSLEVGGVQTLEYRFQHRNGSWVWLRDEMRRVPRRDGPANEVLGCWTDITEYRRAAAALAASEERWRRLVETAPDAIVIHQDGVIKLANRKALELFGASGPSQLVDRRFTDLVLAEGRDEIAEILQRLVDCGGVTDPSQTRVVRIDGRFVDVEMSSAAIVEQGRIAIQTVLRDVTERRRAEEEIRHLVYHDALTGLPNRALLFDRIRQAVQQARRNNRRCAVMLLDLDQFKDINDTLGHPAGDKLLCAVSQRLLDTVRGTDTLARLGGDEFAIVQTDVTSAEGAAILGQKVLDAIARPFLIDDEEVHTTASVGITVVPDDGQESDRLIRNADLALYQAKGEGGNRFRFFHPEMNRDIQLRKSLERDLRRSIERDELSIVLQPQFTLIGHQVVGAEALVRWHHPERGEVAPHHFIPVAEASGLIRPLGRFVLSTACKMIAAWQAVGVERRIAVNLSAAQLKHGDLIQLVRRLIAEHAIDPSLLELEITESLLFEPSNESVADSLRKIAALGVRLSIDDFGTGYSSLAYLKRFPVDKIKIDQSFIRDLGKDSDTEAIVRAMVTLAHSLGKTVLAEGVETEAQLAFLRDAGCDEAQGFVLARPMAPESLDALLRAAA